MHLRLAEPMRWRQLLRTERPRVQASQKRPVQQQHLGQVTSRLVAKPRKKIPSDRLIQGP